MPVEKRRYGGQTIAEWTTRIKNIDPKGPDGIAAVDGLTALVRDEEVPLVLRHRAAITLGRIGPPAQSAVPVFVELLQKHGTSSAPQDRAIVLFSLKALELLGPAAQEAAPLLLNIATNTQQPVTHRASALEALARIGSANPLAVKGVIDMLTRRREAGEDRRDYLLLKRLAADGIAIIGPAAYVAVPQLIRGTRYPDAEVRRKCALALGSMGRRGQQAVIPLAELLTEDDVPAVRDAAGEALALIGPPALPALQKLLKDENAEVRARAALSLGKMGAAARPAVEDLDFALDDDDGWVRIRAAEALWRITGKTDSLVPALIEELKNPQRQIRMQAYRLFKELGPKARSAEFALKRLLSDRRGYVRSAATKALRVIQASR